MTLSLSAAKQAEPSQVTALSLTGNRMRVAEPEFVFRMGRMQARLTACDTYEISR